MMWRAKVGWIANYCKIVISDMHIFLGNPHPLLRTFRRIFEAWVVEPEYTWDQPKSELTLVYQSLVGDLTKYVMVM